MPESKMYHIVEQKLETISILSTYAHICFSLFGICFGIVMGILISGTYSNGKLSILHWMCVPSMLFYVSGVECCSKRQSEIDFIKKTNAGSAV
jgi:predicted Co/Zn/Cd cation transporter (cation efflux family)